MIDVPIIADVIPIFHSLITLLWRIYFILATASESKNTKRFNRRRKKLGQRVNHSRWLKRGNILPPSCQASNCRKLFFCSFERWHFQIKFISSEKWLFPACCRTTFQQGIVCFLFHEYKCCWWTGEAPADCFTDTIKFCLTQGKGIHPSIQPPKQAFQRNYLPDFDMHKFMFRWNLGLGFPSITLPNL